MKRGRPSGSVDKKPRKVWGEGNAAIANFVREHYPHIAAEAAVFVVAEQNRRLAQARAAKIEQKAQEVREKINALEAQLVELGVKMKPDWALPEPEFVAA